MLQAITRYQPSEVRGPYQPTTHTPGAMRSKSLVHHTPRQWGSRSRVSAPPTHHLLHLLKPSEDALLAVELPLEGTGTDERLRVKFQPTQPTSQLCRRERQGGDGQSARMAVLYGSMSQCR